MGWAWTVVAFGAVLMGAAFVELDAPAWMLMTLLSGAPPMVGAALRFAVGLMGAVTFGWGLTVLAAASVSHLLDVQAARALWRRIAAAVVAWYLVDCAISVVTGFGLNSLPNTLLLVAFLLIARNAGLLGTAPSAEQNEATKR